MLCSCWQFAGARKVFSEVAAIRFLFLAECFYVERFGTELSDEQESDCVKSLGTIAKRALVAAVLLLGLVYAGDYLLVRYRIVHPAAGTAFGNVVMDARQPEVNTPCVHSLFPHLGLSPCWYLKRNSQKPIPMVIMPMERP
jgi:hypothetical protein